MQRRSIFYGLLAIWAALFVYSFMAPAMVDVTGDGFLRGANRIKIFLSWHMTALAFAIAIAFLGPRMHSAVRRWTSRGPVFLHIVAATAIIALAFQAYQTGKTHQNALTEESLAK